MENNEPTILTLTSYGKKVSVEIPYSDVTATELIEAFVGLCVCQTWFPETIYKTMKEYAEEHVEE